MGTDGWQWRSAVVILGCIRDSSSSLCSLPSVMSTQEVGNPGLTDTPAVSGKEGAEQEEEAGRRWQITPTCCKNNLLNEAQWHCRGCFSISNGWERPQRSGRCGHLSKSCWGSTGESLILSAWGIESNAPITTSSPPLASYLHSPTCHVLFSCKQGGVCFLKRHQVCFETWKDNSQWFTCAL